LEERLNLVFVGDDGFYVLSERVVAGGLTPGVGIAISRQLVQGDDRVERPAEVAIVSSPGDAEPVAGLEVALLGIGSGDLSGQQVVADATSLLDQLSV
jgi:hypothetical protein